MTGHVIDGCKIADELARDVGAGIARLRLTGTTCGLTTIQVGHHPPSRTYQARLTRLSDELGVTVNDVRLDESAHQDEIIAAVQAANRDPATTGIVVLRPLPRHVSEAAVFRHLMPLKDIEAVHPENAGLLALGVPRYNPSTAASAFHVHDHWLDHVGEHRSDFHHRARIVVVGRSNNVGKPLVSLAHARQAAVELVDE